MALTENPPSSENQFDSAQPTKSFGLRLLFTATIFTSSFLLFLIQPMFARMLLPAVGGAPVVWNTCLVFFQAALLGGYQYAHWLAKRPTTNQQRMIHGVFALLPLIALPIRIPVADATATSQPVVWLLMALLTGVALPYFVVSTSSPLIQHWFSKTKDPNASDPYFLYATSNVGSLLALLAYPFAFEPYVTLAQQSLVWSIGYGVLVVLLLCCATVAAKSPEKKLEQAVMKGSSPSPARFGWSVFGAFVPSCLLMGATTHISTQVASAPMMWVIPLSLYLLTFVLAFAKKPLFPTPALQWIAAPLVVMGLVFSFAKIEGGQINFGIAILAFFFGTWMCHQRLADDRPAANHLTQFYLALSIGGVLGGLFTGLIAPVVFDNVYEYPLALVLCALLISPKSDESKIKHVLWIAIAGLVVSGCVFGYPMLQERFPTVFPKGYNYRLMAMWIPSALICLAMVKHRVRFFASCAILAVCGLAYKNSVEKTIVHKRGYFGHLAVRDLEWLGCRQLVHGVITHGLQPLAKEDQQAPASYYHLQGPAGNIMSKRGLPENPTVALVGLGVGGMLAYAQKGHRWTLYEIDPNVVEIASNPKYFTYMSGAKERGAELKVALGDARTEITKSTDTYDLIVLDAYSSDNIPIHLLTVDAFRAYEKKLKPGGVLAVHVSNRYMNLEEQVAGICKELGFQHRQRYLAYRGSERRFGEAAASWVIVGRETKDLGALATDETWREVTPPKNLRVWTDQRASMIDALMPEFWKNM